MGGSGDAWKIAGSIALSVAGVALALEYNRIAEKAMDLAEDISERIFDIEKDITDHWVNTQYPQNLAVMNEIYDYAPPGTDYNLALQTARFQGESLESAADTGFNVTQDRYRFCMDTECNKELDIHSGAAQIDFAQQLMRHQERREERQTQVHLEYASRAYRATREAPDDIFALMRNAQNTYQNIYNAAMQSVDGAVGLIGYGIGTFIGGFFNN